MTGSAEQLKKKKLKVTLPRQRILDLFINTKEPLSAEAIIKQVFRKGINEVTVYRILAAFQKACIIRQVDLRQNAIFYELAGDHHHHHLVCTACGRIEDFDACVKESMIRRIQMKSKYFAVIDDHAFELFGICRICTSKTS